MSNRMRAIELLLDDFTDRCNELEPLLFGTPTNSQLDQIRKKLEQLTSRLEIATREVKSHSAFMEFDRENVIFQTRQERYRGIQSISSIRSNSSRILFKAEVVRLKLNNLMAIMDIMHPLTAIGLAGAEKIETIIQTQAKGEKYKPDGLDAADQIGINFVVITAIASLVITALASRSNNRGSTTG